MGAAEEGKPGVQTGTRGAPAQVEAELVVEPRREVHECLVVQVAVGVCLAQEIDSGGQADALENELVRDVLVHKVEVSVLRSQVADVDPGDVEAQCWNVGGSHERRELGHLMLNWLVCLVVIG